MADKFIASNETFDELHDKRVAQIDRKIKAIYKQATEEAGQIGAGIHKIGEKPFKFSDFPKAKEQADKLLQELGQGVETTIMYGVRDEWTLANNKNNKLASLFFGDALEGLPESKFQQYFNTNPAALQAFLQRKIAGLNLSDKVWKYTDGFKEEIEMALDLGIRSGKSAAAMSRDLRDYLQHPNKLFRRVKDEHGHLQLSKAAKAFHPSQGVYRSSYMNARRLAVTETNMAYRTADHIRQQQLDFVVGIRVVLSNNHNCKGVPSGHFFDICDELKGDYPKDFLFTGWHPHCRCHTETILKTPAEMKLDTDRILHGRPTATYSRHLVRKTPKNFDIWVQDNKKRIEAASGSNKLPYFIRDNHAQVEKILGKGVIPAPTTQAGAATMVAETGVPTPEMTAPQKEEKPIWLTTGKQADDLLRDQTGCLWNSLSDAEKDALEAYTGDDYWLMNRIMRGQNTGHATPAQVAKAKEQLRMVEKAIDQSTIDRPIWVQRAESIDGLKRFGIADPDKMEPADFKKLVGKTGTEKAFTSTCLQRGAVNDMEGNFDIIYDIKVPKGAKALYTEPFSTYGAGAGRKWNGISKQKQIGGETELLLQRDAKMKVTKVTKGTDGMWHIQMEVVLPKKAAAVPKKLSIKEQAAIRHAARTEEQKKAILDAFHARQKKYATITKEAEEVEKVLDGIKDVDTKTIQKALKKYDLKTVQKETQKLRQIQKELEDCKWVKDPLEAAKKNGMQAVVETEKDITFRLGLWEKKYNYVDFDHACLEHQKAKLEWEINSEIGNGKYKHPELAKKALEGRLAVVEDKLEWQNLTEIQNANVKFLQEHMTNSKLAHQVLDVQTAMDAGDKIAVKKALGKVEKTKSDILAAAQKEAKQWKEMEELKDKVSQMVVNNTDPDLHHSLTDLKMAISSKDLKKATAASEKLKSLFEAAEAKASKTLSKPEAAAIKKMETAKKKALDEVKKKRPDVVFAPNTYKIKDQIETTAFNYSDFKDEAINLGIQHTNVARNTFEAFAKTPDGSIYTKAEIEKLCSSKTKKEMLLNIKEIKFNHIHNNVSNGKLDKIADQILDECEAQVRAVSSFTYEWDYEIRHFQNLDPTLIPSAEKGHTMTKVAERAEALERFIDCSAKWDGGITYRGMSLSEPDLKKMIEDLKQGKGDMLGSASWSMVRRKSEGFASHHIGEPDAHGNIKNKRVVLVTETHSKAVPIRHLSHFFGEHEVLGSKLERWKFISMKEEDGYIFIRVKPA